MKLHLFFSHRLTPDQEEDAKKSLGVEEFVYLPPHLQELFSNVPPQLDSLSEYIEPFLKYLMKNANRKDYILIQGDFGLTVRLVDFSMATGLIPIYATTKRDVVEIEENGKKVRISKFKHVKFRRYYDE